MLVYVLSVLAAYVALEWAAWRNGSDTGTQEIGILAFAWPYGILAATVGTLIGLVHLFYMQPWKDKSDPTEWAQKHVDWQADAGGRVAFVICLVALVWWAL